jgi:hypothetical protein
MEALLLERMREGLLQKHRLGSDHSNTLKNQ